MPQSTELRQAEAALGRRDWAVADGALRSHFLERPVRFVVDPASRASFSAAARSLFPASDRDAAQRADSLLEGRYDLLGYQGLSFRAGPTPVDWHWDPVHGRRSPMRFWARVPYLDPRYGDHKIIWELNRHQHWLTLGRAAWLTGSPRYATAFSGELSSWLRANPPLAGTNWASMLELAFRSISWIWALHLFLTCPADEESPWTLDLLVGLERQLDHVARHLSTYFSPNTHLLGEGLALYVAGRVLPELRSSGRWEQVGRAILLRERHRQVNPDGGHAELSLHYHRYALDFYLLALAVARRTGDAAAEPFAAVVSRLASFCRALASDDGRLPTIGDDDGGMLFPLCGRPPSDASDSLSVAAALLGTPELAVSDPPEEAFWMLGGDAAALVRPGPTGPRCHFFPDTGYAVLRSSSEYAVLDAGPHGFLNGGHAHADALSLVLSTGGQPLLIDPGTATYTMDLRQRDHFRSTAMHNTAVIDGRSQSETAGPFHWASRANARMTLWRPAARTASEARTGDTAPAPPSSSGAQIDYVEAEHDGYRPRVHRRAVIRVREGLWIVADHILGSGPVRVDTYWHLDPAWARDGQGLQFRHPRPLRAAFASTARERQEFYGDAEGLGSCAPIYGRVVPCLTLRLSESAEAPLSVVTAVAASTYEPHLVLEALPVTVEHADGWHRAAVAVTLADTRLVALFATPGVADQPGAGSRSCGQVALGGAHFTTEARVAVLQLSASGDPCALDLIDGTVARWGGRGGFNLPPAASAMDLHRDMAALRQLSREARPVG